MKGLKIINARYTAIEQLPDSIVHLKALGSLNLYRCEKLRKLPEQFGNMEGLMRFDASYSGIEELPDSIGQLKALGSLNLIGCRKLRKLPEQFGNMEGLMRFDASDSGIEELPDSIGQLINLTLLRVSCCERLTSLPDSTCKLMFLKKLVVYKCSKLERLPEQLGEMISLKEIRVCDTAIQEIPDSIGHLSSLNYLQVDNNKKLKDVPSSIWNLTSLLSLDLQSGDIFTSYLPPDSVKDMKNLTHLWLKCNIRLWLPMIVSLTSLEELCLYGEGQSSSSTKWSMSLSKLPNLEELTLVNWGSSYLELPPSLTYLRLSNNATVEQLPDLSNLEHLWRLYIKNCISLQSLPSLPLNLELLFVDECTSLKDVLDVSILKKLQQLRIHHCSNLKLINLKQRCLEVQRQPYIPPFSAQLPNKEIPEFPYFSAQLPNKEIPEWFDFTNNGSRICFNIPSSSSSSVLGVKYLGIALWVVYKYNTPACYPNYRNIMAVITNKTEGIEFNNSISVMDVFVGEDDAEEEEEVQVESKVECISRHRISIKSGDRIEVEFQMSDPAGKVLMCGAHIIIPETTGSISSLL